MRFGRRDHEPYIGGYDPEHEMPNPDRDPRDRWQSDIYRHNAGDSRWAYRWNPDRFESRMEPRWESPRRMDVEREIRPRDRYGRYGDDDRYGYRGAPDDRYDRGYRPDYGPRYEPDFGHDYDRGYYGHGRDNGYNFDRDRWAARERWERERFRDDWGVGPGSEWGGSEWDREGQYGRGGRNRY